MSHKLFKFQNIQLRPTRQNTNLTVQGTQEEQFAEIVKQAQESAIRRLEEEQEEAWPYTLVIYGRLLDTAVTGRRDTNRDAS